jgi:predicted transcriptional regulator
MQSDKNPQCKNTLAASTAAMVRSYAQNHVVASAALDELIVGVHAALAKTKRAKLLVRQPISDRKKPAVSIGRSVTDPFIISLEDGKPYKALKRHLGANYEHTR